MWLKQTFKGAALLLVLGSCTFNSAIAAQPTALISASEGLTPTAWRTMQVANWTGQWRSAYQFAYQVPILTSFTDDEYFVESVRLSLDPRLIPGDEQAAVQATIDLITAAWKQAFTELYGPKPVIPNVPPPPPCTVLKKALAAHQNRLLYLENRINSYEGWNILRSNEIQKLEDEKRTLKSLREQWPYYDTRPLEELIDAQIYHLQQDISYDVTSIEWMQVEIQRINDLIAATNTEITRLNC